MMLFFCKLGWMGKVLASFPTMLILVFILKSRIQIRVLWERNRQCNKLYNQYCLYHFNINIPINTAILCIKHLINYFSNKTST